MSNTTTITCNGVAQPVVDRIVGDIDRGELEPGEKIGTEVELARTHAISRMTVRRAMDHLVNHGLIERRAGKGLFVREPHTATRVIQVVVPDISIDFHVQVARGAKREGLLRGRQIQVYDAHGSLDQCLQILRELPKNRIDGAVISGALRPKFAQVFFDLNAAGFPFVLLADNLYGLNVPSVMSDSTGGAYEVGRKLMELGHQRVGFIGDKTDQASRTRVDALRDAVNDANLPFDRSLVMDLQIENPIGNWSEEIDRCTRELMARPDRPTALFCANDFIAADAYKVLKNLGLSIPEDISVVGFDGEPLCRWLEPNLSTVRQPSRKMGERAMKLLLERIEHPDVRAEHAVLPMTFEPGDSIAPPGRRGESESETANKRG